MTLERYTDLRDTLRAALIDAEREAAAGDPALAEYVEEISGDIEVLDDLIARRSR